MVAGAWFRDDKGVEHQAVACLTCGTVHATYGSPAKVLFSFGSRGLSVAFYLTKDKLQKIANGEAPGPLGRAGLAGLELPGEIEYALVERGHISVDQPDVGMDEEAVDRILTEFARQFVLFSVMENVDMAKDGALTQFMDYGLDNPGGDAEKIVSAITPLMAQEVITPDRLWRRIVEVVKYIQEGSGTP